MQNIKNIFEFYQSSGVYNRVILKEKNKKNLDTLENLRKKTLRLKEFYNKEDNQLVFADGNNSSKIMIIGDIPGVSDEIHGKPFSGEAGLLLDKMLEAISLNRKKVYITNIVNFRLPDNKKLEENDIKRFRPLIDEHIKIINPKLILLFGTSTLQAFYEKYSITKVRGKWLKLVIENKSYNCMSSFHPSFLIRQPQQKKDSWQDLKKLRKKIIENSLC
tara:strand:- start:36289 stop:36942 length:654 start_codon:yes stop_codon:yes gene_type:complete